MDFSDDFHDDFFSIELGPRLCNSTHLEVLVVGGAQLEGVEFEIHRNEGDAAFAHEIKLWAPENIILQASTSGGHF